MAVETVEADDTEVPEKSIREELESSLSEVTARQESEHVQATTGSDNASPQADRAAGDTRTRGPDGKFARAETPAIEPTGAAVLPGTQEGARQPLQTGGTSPQQVALPAPNGWKAEEKALWAKVPPEVQQVINRREQEAHRAITSQDEVRLIGNNFMSVANQHAPLIQARGLPPVELWRETLGIISQLNSPDPAVRAQMVRQIAHSNGVDIRSLMGQPNAQGPQQPNIPIDQLVQRQVNEVFQARQRQEAEARERAEMQATNSEIESFRSKTDASGQPAYPYFDHVTSLMASILGGGVVSTLEEAYQLAVKAHPETSKLITQAEQAQVKAREEAQRKAQAKRRASGSIRGGPGSSSQPNGKDRSIRDELTAAFEEARGRV
jgi:hypothetical protein